MTTQLNGQTLPEGWVWATVSDIGSVKSGQTPNRITEVAGEGNIPWYRVSDMNTFGNEVFLHNSQVLLTQEEAKALRLNIQPAGTIVFPKRGGAIRTNKKRILSKPSAYDLNTMGVIPCLTTVMYLWYWFMTVDLGSLADGSNVPQINHSDIEPLQLPLAPLNEQRRIVAAIETQFTRLDAAVTALKRSQANLKRYRAAVLKAACEGRLVPTEAALAQAEGRSYEPASILLERILAERRHKWEAENPKKKYQEPVAPDTSGLPELPEGWCWVSLDIIAQVRTGVAKGRKFDNQHVVSLPYLRVANVQDGYLDLSEIKTIEILANEIERYHLKPHDILFNEGGDRDKLGRGAIWLGDIQDCIHQNHVFAARLYTSNIEPKWVNFTRQLTYARDHFWKQASQTTNLASINSTNLRSLPIPAPPHDEQVRIIAEVERRLSLIDQLEKTIKTDLARANRLRQSILKRAFAGKLVLQDPNDEPASVLLARIGA